MSNTIEWLTVGGRPAFRGRVGGYPRLIVAETKRELRQWIKANSGPD